MENNLESDWNKLLYKISEDFNVDADLNGTLLLIGIQERGLGFKETYSKQDKMDHINLATCTLLIKWNYYEVVGYDENKWTIFKKNKLVPPFSKEKEDLLLKSSIVEYFKENGYFEN
ncbi:hypothetical protein GCQ56_15940 [Marinifilum sp. N1E240]|uniref:hypothetical protein n=1 Tax=Marinifilum sp. N1E240 TaxID=2608082 RepID=UPI00128B845F|nr:hypothetical protein [Marinifilum sp. N1E240]MPQ48495.1 hypothetical protein [Marinifilum sp. N1E240]